jgi:phosphatidylethanolamine-binding protein (PEBP) family uncharacterized protein
MAQPPVPAGSKQTITGTDGATWYGYTGPCPGGALTTYPFTLYALKVATLPGLSPQSTEAAVQQAIDGAMLAKATLTATAAK